MKLLSISEIIKNDGIFTDGDWIESKDQDLNGNVRLIQLADIGDGSFLDKSSRYMTKRNALRLKCTFLQKGDVLIARMPDPLGRACIFPGSNKECVTVVDICIVRPNSMDISSNYLKDMINNGYYRSLLNRYSTGTTRRRISRKNLDKIKFKFPKFHKQVQIAGILSRAERLIEKRKEGIRLLDEFLKSIFLEMFGDPVWNEKGWDVVPFHKIGQFISGGTPSKSRDDYWSGKFPWISPKDMKVSKLYDAEDHISEIVFNETSLKQIAPNHLLIVVRGMILVHSFPVAINAIEVAINQDMKAINPIYGIDVVYLQNCLNALLRQILKLISTAGHGTRKFDSNAMKKLFIPKPPIEIQTQFVDIVKRIESIKTKYTQSFTDLKNLYDSLSQRAFKGELNLD